MDEITRSGRSWRRFVRVAAAVVSVAGWLMASPRASSAQQASSSVYVRVDSDRTTVVTPRLSVQAPLDDQTRVDLLYTMDIWSSASIDIRSSASRVVTERRDELQASVSHEFSDASVSLGYRYSYEPDYESHTPSLGLRFDFADKSSTLELGGSVSFDDVGRVGDPYYDRSLESFTGQLTFTQVLDKQTLLQGVYTLGYENGFLSSPYRYVGVGSANGACGGRLNEDPVRVGPGGLEYCLPENNPSERTRHAFVLRGMRALAEAFSVGLAYRFYIDDWQLLSHTVLADLHWLPGAETTFALRYRFYLQSAASQYRSRFPSIGSLREFYSRDKELSPFTSHRLALEVERNWPLAGSAEKFRGVLSIGPTVYLYSNFIPYDHIFALEATLSAVLLL